MTKKQTILGTGIVFLFLALVASDSQAAWLVDSRGDITVEVAGSVLGESLAVKPDDVGNPQSDQVMVLEEDEAENSTEETSGPSNSASAPGKTKANVQITTKSNGSHQVDIKTKEKSPSSVKAVPVKDSLKLQVYDENQEELELDVDAETDEIELTDHEDTRTTRIRSKDNASYVIRNKVAAQSHFPIMVNLETNELIITTPKGQKTVTILPDKAVANMLAANVLDQPGGKGGIQWLEYQASLTDEDATGSADLDDDDATGSGDLEAGDPATGSGDLETPPPSTESAFLDEPVIIDEAEIVIDLVTTDDGTLAYEIEGDKTEKFLGLTDVKLKRKAVVSAETGELLEIIQDFRTRLLDFFSF